MADLLAIVSRSPQQPVDPGELERLIEAHEDLRGPAATIEKGGSDWARVCVLSRAGAGSCGIEGAGDGWIAWAGTKGCDAAAMSAQLETIDGQFALLRCDGGEAVRIATDPLGMKPLYVAENGEQTYVSTSVLALARHLRARPDRLGLDAFLRSGMQFGQQTQWSGISRMRPAEYRQLGPDGQSGGTYWEPAIDESAGDLSLADAAEYCIGRATAAISARYAGSRPWLDLTGGFDSRLLSLLSAKSGIEFMTNTVGDAEDEDVRLGRRVAAAGGWPWSRIDLPAEWPEQLPEFATEALGWGDGHLELLSLAGVLLGHREKSELETTLLNGGGGEEYRDHPWGHELLGAGRSTKVAYSRFIDWRLLLPIDLSVLRRDPTAEVSGLFRAELEARAAPFSSMPNTFQDDLLYAYKMTGHTGAYQAAAGAWMGLEAPFFLRPVFLSVISIPPRHRRLHRLMREMMRQLNPAIAAIPTETGGPAEPVRWGNLHRFAPYAWRRARRFGVRARGKLPQIGGAEAETAPGVREAASAALLDSLRKSGRLDPKSMRSAALYEQSRLADLLDLAVTHPTAVDWQAVGRIVTVELALEAADAGIG